MKLLLPLLLLFTASLAAGQSSTNPLTASGGTASTCTGNTAAAGACVYIQNPNNFTAIGLEEIPNGGLTAASITVQGCYRGGTCDAASNTNTSTSNATIGISFPKVYDFFLVVGTFSGGTTPSFTINAHVGVLPASGSATSVSITGPLDGGGNVKVNCESGCAGSNPNGQATMANSAPVVIASNQSAVSATDTANILPGAATTGQTGFTSMGAATTAAPSYTTAKSYPLSLTIAGALRTDASATTQPISGTVSVTGPNANGQATMAASAPVVIASNQSAVPVTDNLTQVAGATLSKTNPVQVQPSDGTNQITAAISAYGTAPTGTEVEGVNAFVTNLVSGNITQFGGVNISTGTGASGTGIPRVTISNDSSLAANQSVNVNQFGGTSATAKAASTQSAATDTSLVVQMNPNQPSLTTPWVDNVTQFGGVALSTGTGASGTGIPRVTVSNDSQVKVWDGSNQATVKAAATNASAASDTSLVVQILAQGNSPCNGFFGGNVFTTVSGTTSGTSATQIVALSAGKKIWVCASLFTSTSGTTPTISLVYGTGSNCATGQTVLMPAMALAATAGTPINIVGTFVTASANALCYLQTGTTPVASYAITYAQL